MVSLCSFFIFCSKNRRLSPVPILDYDSMCSKMDFTPEKSFSSNYKNSQLLLTAAAALSQNDQNAVTPHNEIKCVLNIIESYSSEKMSQNFHICLQSGLTGLTPPPPYGQPDRKISVFFTPRLTRCLDNLGALVLILLTELDIVE